MIFCLNELFFFKMSPNRKNVFRNWKSEKGKMYIIVSSQFKKTGHMDDFYSFNEKVVVLTGGTCFIGDSVARYLAGLGAYVVILGQSLEFGQKVISEIKDEGGEATFFVTDFSNHEALKKNLHDILLEYGRVDVLINDFSGKADFLDNFDFDILFNKSEIVGNKMQMPFWIFISQIIKQTKGTILNFIYCSSDESNYVSPYSRLNNFTITLANKLILHDLVNIKVNSIDLGFINEKEICLEYQTNKMFSPVFSDAVMSQNGKTINMKSDNIYV